MTSSLVNEGPKDPDAQDAERSKAAPSPSEDEKDANRSHPGPTPGKE